MEKIYLILREKKTIFLMTVVCFKRGQVYSQDIKREKLCPNIYVSHMAQVVEKTQTDAYIDFVAKYPHIKIGQRTSDKLKPFFVRAASEKDRNTCCCRYHIESNFLFKSCIKFRKSKNQSETSVVESYPVYENLGEIIDVTLCPKVNGSYKKRCLDRKCTECEVQKLKFSIDCFDVEWQKYEYVNENPKGTATKRRLTLVKKETKVGAMFDYLLPNAEKL